MRWRIGSCVIPWELSFTRSAPPSSATDETWTSASEQHPCACVCACACACSYARVCACRRPLCVCVGVDGSLTVKLTDATAERPAPDPALRRAVSAPDPAAPCRPRTLSCGRCAGSGRLRIPSRVSLPQSAPATTVSSV